MAVYGKTGNFHPIHGNASGTLLLTYTIGSTAASFTYKGPGVGDKPQGPYGVTFRAPLQAGVVATGSLAPIGNPPLHIPGDGGDFHAGTVTFTPPLGSNKGSLIGNFSSKVILTELGWEADAGTERPKLVRYRTAGEK